MVAWIETSSMRVRPSSSVRRMRICPVGSSGSTLPSASAKESSTSSDRGGSTATTCQTPWKRSPSGLVMK